MKRIAVFLGHPAHYHMFKNMVAQLESDGYEVSYFIKRKDILEDLVRESGHDYVVVRSHERKNAGKLGLAWAMFAMDVKVAYYLIKNKSQLLIGTYAPFLSHLTNVPMLITCEDDASVVPLFAKLSYPYASAIICPTNCDGGKWDSQMIKYDGFQKLTYLHPNRFVPDKKIVEKYFGTVEKPFFLLRFSRLNAHHDGGVAGINAEVTQKIVEILEPYGNIYITSERPLEPQFEKYRLHIDPLDIHHVMAYASIYIGDSQSMAVEAAMLGTPSVRFNDFAGKIGVLEELEQKYQLTKGIPSSQPQLLYDTIQEWLSMPNLKEVFQQRRQHMLDDKIDVTAFFIWLVKNYPESKQIMKENPDFQFQFK